MPVARTYKRDSRGRFAGGGGSSSSRPPARQVSRGANRLTRDNAGRITSVGGNGATARGGRLRTAAGNLRATQTARLKGGAGRLRGGAAAPKPKGWAQSPAARADRAGLAKERQREARFLKSLPKGARKAIRLAAKNSNQFVGSSQRIAINQAATMLRSQFGKRKKMSPGAAQSVFRSMEYSARRMQAALAMPKRGKRLRSLKASQSGDRLSLRPTSVRRTIRSRRRTS